MTDHDLAQALIVARDTEAEVRAYWLASNKAQDLAEADAALTAMRHATALRRSLETWSGTRAVRKSRQQVASS